MAFGYIHLKEPEKILEDCLHNTEYLEHASPAVLRAKALDLFRLSREHQTELNLVKDLLITVGHLNRYADLVERMYIEALNTGYGAKPNQHSALGPSCTGQVVGCPSSWREKLPEGK